VPVAFLIAHKPRSVLAVGWEKIEKGVKLLNLVSFGLY
jgi:hypothetical protein